jgi:hypothetical protein
VRGHAAVDADKLLVKRELDIWRNNREEQVRECWGHHCKKWYHDWTCHTTQHCNHWYLDWKSNTRWYRYFHRCHEEYISKQTAPGYLAILGDFYFNGQAIDNIMSSISIAGNLVLLDKIYYTALARELERTCFWSDRSDIYIPAVTQVHGKIIGNATGIENIIVEGNKVYNPDNLLKIGDGSTAGHVMRGNLGNINVPTYSQDVAGITGVDINRPVTTKQQHANFIEIIPTEYFNGDNYQVNTIFSDEIVGYKYVVQEKYPALAECAYGIASLLHQQGIKPENVPPILCTPNVQANLLEKVMHGLTGVPNFILGNNHQLNALWNQIADGKSSVDLWREAIENVAEPQCTQLEILLKNCDKYGHLYGYKYPDGVPADRIPEIEKAFACPVEREFNGKKVVTVEVYLPKQLISSAPSWFGAFMQLGSVDLRMDGDIVNIGMILINDGGKLIANNLANFGQFMLAGGTLDIEIKQKLLVASLVQLTVESYGLKFFGKEMLSGLYGKVSSKLKSEALIKSIGEGQFYIHGESSALVMGAKLEGKIAIEIDGAFYVVPSKLYYAMISYNQQSAFLRNYLAEFKEEISVKSEMIMAEGLIIKPGSTVEFIGKKGVLFIPAFDQAEDWDHHCWRHGTFNPRSGNLWGLPQRWIALY